MKYIYINYVSGRDTADGTKSDPIKTLNKAFTLANNSGYDSVAFVIMTKYTMGSTYTAPKHTYGVTITANDGETDYRANGAKLTFGNGLRYILGGSTTFENITVEYSGTLNFVCEYNPVTFGEGFATKSLNGDVGVYVVGGFQSPTDKVATSLDSHITIKSGDFKVVVGGSRDKADGVSGSLYKINTFTGTHHISVSGGTIKTLLGASAVSQYSHSAIITVTGGEITELNVGGDKSRRLNGDGTAILTGGTVGTLNVNNILGNGNIYLDGAKVNKVDVWCYNDEVTKLEAKENNPKTLYYNANYYTADQISSFSSAFDAAYNTACVYASANGTGTGNTTNDPASFESAVKKAVEAGSTVAVLGKISLNGFTEPVHEKAITITGADDSAELVINGKYTLNGNTEFSALTVTGGIIDSQNGTFIASSDLKISGNLDINGNAELYGGTYNSVTAGSVIVKGASIKSVTSTGKAKIEIISGNVETLIAEGDELALTVSGGEIGKILFNGVKSKLTYTLSGGSVKEYEVKGNNVKGELYANDGFNLSSLGTASELFELNSNKVYYLRDGGTGDGSSEANAGGSLAKAYYSLKKGGTLIICNTYTIDSQFQALTHSGKITITSVYGGVDYAKKNGAELVFKSNYFCGGDTEFNNITIASEARYLSIFGNYHKLTMGDGLNCVSRGEGNKLSIMGGSNGAASGKTSELTINSGHWQRVRGGAAADGSTSYNVIITVNGGTFVERLTLGSSGSHDGSITATINGGTFYQGVFASTLTSESQSFNSDTALEINGGTFYARISAAFSSIGTYNGTYTVRINGGEFAHLVGLEGTETLSGNITSMLESKIDLKEKETGTYTFTNPVRIDGADPWLFYHDGFYYYTSTISGGTLKLTKVANIGDLIHSTGYTIYEPEAGHPWSDSSWSPEIHYYTDEEIGEGNGGWYCYIGADGSGDEVDGVHHRMYVLKCLDGDNLTGRWGDPVTGEVNVPRLVVAPDMPEFDKHWSAGASDIRINGKLYMMYVSSRDEGTPNTHQTINIVEMTNPWTISGQSSVICVPEYDWEMEGYHQNPVTGQWSPKVIEGSTAVYGDDGSIFIVYTGSNYTNAGYKLGQLKYLGGDPLDKNSWEKKPTSIFSKTDKVNGPGHACYVTDTSGQKWICYVAYLGKTAGGTRYAMVEPYTADKNGVVIGEGTTHPADPEKVYTAEVNPLPLWDKTVGFTTVHTVKAEEVITDVPNTSDAPISSDDTEMPEAPAPVKMAKWPLLAASGIALCIASAVITAIIKRKKR
ncbi:MAG: family 43 glycosylhydrolase [Clostridia bacterium]|nr:family 43 glycosylhydrolase [Clostridia bacterium]